MANMRGSRVVCSVSVTTSWLSRLVSKSSSASTAGDDNHPEMGVARGVRAHFAGHPQAMIKQAVAEPVGSSAVVEPHAVLGHSGRVEVIRHRACRDHQVVVADPVPGDDLAAVVV